MARDEVDPVKALVAEAVGEQVYPPRPPAPTASPVVRAGCEVGWKLAEAIGARTEGKIVGGLIGGLLAAWAEAEARRKGGG